MWIFLSPFRVMQFTQVQLVNEPLISILNTPLLRLLRHGIIKIDD
jgi:hypothetical protein